MRERLKQVLGLPSFQSWRGAEYGTAKQFHDYDQHLKVTYPNRYKVYDFFYRLWLKVQPGRRLKDAKYWVYYRFHPKHKYTTIKISRLEPGYYDEDTLMLYVLFEIFERFMKRQLTDPHHVWEYTEEDFKAANGDWICDEAAARQEIAERNARWNEMKAIYEWWTVTRPNRESTLPDFPSLPKDWGAMAPLNEDFDNEPQMQEWGRVADIRREAEANWDKEDEDMMHRLINIRGSLWD